MNKPTFDYLPVAIRAHAVRHASVDDDGRGPHRRQEKFRELPQRTLILDCETTTDPTQRLRFGVYRIYSDAQDRQPGTVCIREGIFHADDLPAAEVALLYQYAKRNLAKVNRGHRTRLTVMSRTEFVTKILWKWGHDLKATILGYNLPFDLSRLAVHASAARGQNHGGISLQLWEHNGKDNPFRPRIVLRSIDAHRTLIRFTTTAEQTTHFYRGKFLDLRTLAFAHSDQRGLTFEAACHLYEVPYTKRDVQHDAPLTDDYITYCREDVEATSALYRAAHIEHQRHPIALPARSTFSAATIGKAYWTALGLNPFQARDGWLSHEMAGYGMAAFYGGRSECRIRRLDVPVVYCDFTSMYMTCNTLMHTWQLITSDQLIATDNTPEVRALLDVPDLRDRCFDKTLWPMLHTLVEVEPNGAILPVRARYDNASPTWGIGINPYQSERACWYPLADIIAAHLLGGPAPIIRRAYRITANQHVNALSTTRLRGRIEINPKHQDFFATTVEERHRAQCDNDNRYPQFLKVLANSTGFGILAQYDRKHSPDPIPVVVHADRAPFTVTTTAPEDPGDYCAPPIAACLTGAARLVLALLEHEVTQAGGTYAFCDTDSMAIISTRRPSFINCPGGTHDNDGTPAVRALSWKQVRAIIDTFTQLNPYDPAVIPGSILRIEGENYHRNTRRQRELRCYAISAKRYQLTTTEGRSVKRSEHGLGHLLNPTGRGDWITDAWQHIRHPHTCQPEWLDEPALSQITVASPDALAWFKHINHGKLYADQIKPANFLLIAHPDPLNPAPVQPVAAYSPSPATWRALPWIDRNTNQPITITTRPHDGNLRPAARVLTYRDILTAYHAHPEHKALGPNHTPIRPDTIGLLQRRPIHAAQPVTFIGKEANDLDNRAHTTTDTNDVTTYTARDDTTWHALTIPILKTVTTTAIAAATGVNIRTIQRAIRGTRPHASDRAALHNHAVATARQKAPTRRTENDHVTMYKYLQFENGPE